jgi:hypothetical protein
MSKPIPEFKNEDEEREFWATHDSTDYVDWSQAEHASFPNLALSSTRPGSQKGKLTSAPQKKNNG